MPSASSPCLTFVAEEGADIYEKPFKHLMSEVLNVLTQGRLLQAFFHFNSSFMGISVILMLLQDCSNVGEK